MRELIKVNAENILELSQKQDKFEKLSLMLGDKTSEMIDLLLAKNAVQQDQIDFLLSQPTSAECTETLPEFLERTRKEG